MPGRLAGVAGRGAGRAAGATWRRAGERAVRARTALVAGLAGVLAGGLVVAGLLATGVAPRPADEPADGWGKLAETEQQAYWSSRYNYNAMLLMTGLGERLEPAEGMPEQLAELAGFDLAEMPDNPYLLGAVYASGDPHFQQEADFSDLSTLNWDRDSMDTTLQPEAQALTIAKITAAGLRTDYHQAGKDRFIALVQLQEARAMAGVLHEELTGEDGLVATVTPEGRRREPEPGQQAAALWAYSSLALALSDPARPLYQQLPDAGADALRARRWAAELFTAADELAPQTPRDLALTIQAAGWFAAAIRDPELQQQALARVQELGEALRQTSRGELDGHAWAVYGLGSASRLTGDPRLADAARRVFVEDVEPRWDADAGVYAPAAGAQRYVYTPQRTAAVIAALNTLRLVAPPGVGSEISAEALDERYVTFFGNAVVRSGLQQAHAIPLAVSPAYLQQRPRSHFTAPQVPLSADGHGDFGLCPVYAAEVAYDDGEWTVVDRTFHTADAMLLATLSTWSHRTDPDGFAPRSHIDAAST